MKISARYLPKATITTAKNAPICSPITHEIAPGLETTSSVSSDSVKALKQKKSQPAYAVIKASRVLVGVP